MSKRDLLKLADDFEGNMRTLLATPPAPHGTMGSREVTPNAERKPRQKRKPKPPKKAGTYAYESAPVKKAKKKART